MSARLNVPCSVNGRDEMEIVAYPDGSFEFVARTRAAGAVAPMGGAKEVYIVLSRENFLRMCMRGLDVLMKKVVGV